MMLLFLENDARTVLLIFCLDAFGVLVIILITNVRSQFCLWGDITILLQNTQFCNSLNSYFPYFLKVVIPFVSKSRMSLLFLVKNLDTEKKTVL